MIQQLADLGESEVTIREYVKLLNTSILTIPIFNDLNIPNDVLIWLTIFIGKQVRLNRAMQQILPVDMTTKQFANMLDTIMKFSVVMRSDAEPTESKKFLAL